MEKSVRWADAVKTARPAEISAVVVIRCLVMVLMYSLYLQRKVLYHKHRLNIHPFAHFSFTRLRQERIDAIISAMKTILLLTRVESPAFTAMKNCILPLSKERGWAVHVFAVGGMDTTAQQLIRAWNPDGCIAYAARSNGLSCDFRKWRKPLVILNAPHPVRGVTAISHDSSATGLLAASELLSLGLDHFACFATISRQPWVETRFEYYAGELKKRGLSVIRYSKGSVGDWLVSLPKPCGIFAANDLMAENIVAEAFARGLSIPNDIALVGCDDNPQICEHAEVSISSIMPDFPRCATLAVDALKCVMEGKSYTGESIYGDIGVTRRASTRPIVGHPPQISAMLEHIRLNAFSGITAADVLDRFSGSRRSLEDRFRKATGRSILEEIQAVRLMEVERLLANPAVQIGSIASRAGYASENFLARLFKRTHGITMSEWRNAQQGKR